MWKGEHRNQETALAQAGNEAKMKKHVWIHVHLKEKLAAFIGLEVSTRDSEESNVTVM